VIPRIFAGYAMLMVTLGVAVIFGPATWSAVLWAAIALFTVAAIVGGTFLHRPERRSPWWLFAGAVLAMGIGDTIFGATVHSPTQSPPIIADLAYLLMFPLVTAGFIDFTRTGAVLRDRSRLLDLLAFACSAGLALWAAVLGPAFGASHLGWDDRSTLAAYTIGDLLILTATVRLLVAAPRRPAMLLLTIGAFGTLVGDVWYSLAEVHDGWRPGNWGEACYLLFYLAWGAAGLHRSMKDLTSDVPMRAKPIGGWTWLLGLAIAIPLATLLVESLVGGVRDGVVIAATSVVTFALVVTRLVDAMREHQAALARERALRVACAAIVTATSHDEVTDAMRAGVHALLPAAADHAVALRFNEADESAAYPLPPDAANRRTRLATTSMLGDDVRDQFEAFRVTLVCPLIVDRRAERDPGAGALFVAADEPALLATQDALEVLAAQAALALERIALTGAANCRDSDEYLRAVVQNTADVVVIIDEDQRIRYASPSLQSVLDIVPPPAATLRDIVHPDDHDQVAQTLTAAERLRDGAGARDVWSLRRPDGSRAAVEVSYRDLRHDRIVRGIIVTMRDITDEQEQRLESIRRTLDASPAGQNRRSVSRKFN
jgi:PAS domain S-box-containing protein